MHQMCDSRNYIDHVRDSKTKWMTRVGDRRSFGRPDAVNYLLSGNPGRKNGDIGRLESHQVGAISGCELAERLPETHERRRMR